MYDWALEGDPTFIIPRRHGPKKGVCEGHDYSKSVMDNLDPLLLCKSTLPEDGWLGELREP